MEEKYSWKWNFLTRMKENDKKRMGIVVDSFMNKNNFF